MEETIMGAFILLLPVIKEQLKRQRANREPPRTPDLLLTSINRFFLFGSNLIHLHKNVSDVSVWVRQVDVHTTQLYATMEF